MPQLPSGLHCALDPSPLSKLIEEARAGTSTPYLLAIEKPSQVFAHIKVMFFRARTGDAVKKEGDASPDGMEAYFSGYTLATIGDEVEAWAEGDRVAFEEFLGGLVKEGYFAELFAYAQQVKEELLNNPKTSAGLQAIWWKMGTHPLQKAQEDF